jgi:hypothetical protein
MAKRTKVKQYTRKKTVAKHTRRVGVKGKRRLPVKK